MLRRTPDGRYVSYAQCGEDAVLMRVFGDQENGCWIDVGANDPNADSVTRIFSDMGWSGINVEPVESLHTALVAERPRDVNLLAGLSDHDGELTFHRVDSNLGLSTFEADLASHHRNNGESITEVRVPITTLAAVCEEHLGGRTIDFLKVDTERHELPVLRGHDFARFPVRVLLAETGDDFQPVIDHVTGQGMRFVQYDGLNSWFVGASESEQFAALVARPVHRVLDGYHPAIYVDMLDGQHARITELQTRLDQLETGGVLGVARRARAQVRRGRQWVAARRQERRESKT